MDIIGTDGQDTLFGGKDSDAISGLDGGDFLTDDQGGDDLLQGGKGDDYLYVLRHGKAATDVTLDGGSGDDSLRFSDGGQGSATLLGGGGDDSVLIEGGGRVMVNLGVGDDVLELNQTTQGLDATLGAGRDSILLTYNFQPSAHGSLTVRDFAAGDGGDRFDWLSYLARTLTGWDQTANPFADGHLRLVQQGSATLVQMDVDGALDASDWSTLFVLKGTQIGDFTAWNFRGLAPDGSISVGETLDGSAAGDVLEGGGGGDVMHGEGSNDILYGGAGADALFGDDGDDLLDGETGADRLTGGDGDDHLSDVEGGDDRIFGQAGADSIFVQHLGPLVDHVVLDGGSGDDVIQMFGFGQTTDKILGRAGADHVTIDGAAFSKVALGGGDDTVRIGLAHGTYDLTLGAGSDTVTLEPAIAYFASWPVFQVDVRDFAAGDGGDRLLTRNVLSGLGHWDGVSDPFADGILRLAQRGHDTVVQVIEEGFNNSDWIELSVLKGVRAAELTAFNLDGLAPGPVATLGTGAGEKITGTAAGEVIDAAAGADTVSGGGGDDSLRGGQGADRLLGGDGGDSFVYWFYDESTSPAADLITDLGAGDRIDLSAIDANMSASGDQAFHLVAAFTHAAGELVVSYDAKHHLTRIEGDVYGEGAADLVITVSGDHRDFTDFVL